MTEQAPPPKSRVAVGCPACGGPGRVLRGNRHGAHLLKVCLPCARVGKGWAWLEPYSSTAGSGPEVRRDWQVSP